MDRWNDIGLAYWSKRSERQRWVHEYILYPEYSRIINEIGGTVILDYGCGDGSLINYLLNVCKHRTFYAYDESREMRNIAKKMLHKEIALEHLSENAYDIICLNMVIQDVEDPTELLIKLESFLVPKGIMLISMPHPVFSLIESRHLTTKREIISNRAGRENIYRYLDEDSERVYWTNTNWTNLYNRTISTYSTAIREAGYFILDITEPLPNECSSNNKDLYLLNSELPSYLFWVIQRS